MQHLKNKKPSKPSKSGGSGDAGGYRSNIGVDKDKGAHLDDTFIQSFLSGDICLRGVSLLSLLPFLSLPPFSLPPSLLPPSLPISLPPSLSPSLPPSLPHSLPPSLTHSLPPSPPSLPLSPPSFTHSSHIYCQFRKFLGPVPWKYMVGAVGHFT